MTKERTTGQVIGDVATSGIERGFAGGFQLATGVSPDIAWKSIFKGQEKVFEYGNNVINPFTMPDASSIIDAWLKGADSYSATGNYIPSQTGQCARWLQNFGIPLWTPGTINEEAVARFNLDSSKPQEFQLKTNCISAWNKVLEYSFGYPSPETIVKARFAGLIDADAFPKLMRRAGAKPEQWQIFEPLIQDHISPNELMTLLRRGLINEEQFKSILKLLGISDEAELTMLLKLRDETPTITDIIQFHRRQLDALGLIFSNDYFAGFSANQADTVAAFTKIFDQRQLPDADRGQYFAQINDYYANIPEGFEDRDFYGQNKKYLDAVGVPLEQSLLHYLSAWQVPPPTQCLNFYYKLREDNISEWFFNLYQRQYNPDDANDVALAQKYLYPKSQLIKHLLDSNIIPRDVNRYIASAYHPPSIRFINDLYNNVPAAQGSATNWFLQLGYSPATVDQMAHALEIRKKRTLASQGHGYTPSELSKLFSEGLINEVGMRQKLADLEFEQDAIEACVDRAKGERSHRAKLGTIKAVQHAFSTGAITEQQASDRLVSDNYDLDFATTLIQEWKFIKEQKDSEADGIHRQELIKAWTKAGEAAYESNHIDLSTAYMLLVSIGMNQQNILLQLRLWEFKRESKLKLPDKQSVSKMIIDGLLSPIDGIYKLVQSGYTLEDAVYVCLDAWITTQKDLRKAILAGTKSVQAEYDKMLKQAQAQAAKDKITLTDSKKLPDGKTLKEVITL